MLAIQMILMSYDFEIVFYSFKKDFRKLLRRSQTIIYLCLQRLAVKICTTYYREAKIVKFFWLVKFGSFLA